MLEVSVEDDDEEYADVGRDEMRSLECLPSYYESIMVLHSLDLSFLSFVMALGYTPFIISPIGQIVQFVFSFAISGLMPHYQFTGLSCSGIRGWYFNAAAFNASLLVLFVDFSVRTSKYSKKKDKRM